MSEAPLYIVPEETLRATRHKKNEKALELRLQGLGIRVEDLVSRI